jgi:uncharacterized protein with HEPN domain
MLDIHSLEAFDNDIKTKDAIVFNLLQLGELANHKLTDTFKNKYNSIPWQKMYGLRNRIVHDYDSVHSLVIYQVITEDLQELSDEITQLLND